MLSAAPVIANPPSSKFWFWIEDNPGPIKIEDVKRVICEHFNITGGELLSQQRNHDLVHARQLGMYLARILSKRSFLEIGRRFDRNHTTIQSACRKIGRLVKTDKEVVRELAQIREKLL